MKTARLAAFPFQFRIDFEGVFMDCGDRVGLGDRKQAARGVPGTRVEFDKAMISIVLNVGGLIHMVKEDGDLIDLRMGDLCEDPSKQAFIQRVTRAVFDVGRAIGAYPPDADFDAIWAPHRATIMAHAGHMTSSVKTFRDALAGGLAGVKLFSNEEWILNPLGRYAASAGMSAEEGLFRSLKNQVQEAMARAIRFRKRDADGGESRTRTMKLTAQRNFTVELYDRGWSTARTIRCLPRQGVPVTA